MITFLQLAKKVLEEERRALSVTEIWAIATEKGYAQEVQTKGKTPSATLGALLYVDARDNAHSPFVTGGSRPKRFALRGVVDIEGAEKVFTAPPNEEVKRAIDYLEKDLHPFVVYHGFYHLRAHLKTIDHARSGKKTYGEWVHPDIVGCYYPFQDWTKEVVEVSDILGDPAIKLFSFELKRELSFANLREAFFQAVSNSSWASEGYIAAAKINAEDDFRSELKRLSSAFGIGVVEIDVADPDATEVIFPARERDALDWETINKLAEMNEDFREFLERVKNDATSREIRKEKYDAVHSKESLIAHWEKRARG